MFTPRADADGGEPVAPGPSRLLRATIPRPPGPAGQAGSARPRHRITVTLLTPDPVSEAGIVSMLGKGETVILPPSRVSECDVMIVVARSADQALLEEMLAVGGGVPVILVLGAPGNADPVVLAELGVRASIWRPEITPERLRGEIHALAWLSAQEAADRLAGMLEPSGPPNSAEAPSGREIEVLRYIAEGLDTAEIAEVMRYSERTVKNILYSVTTRLGLGNRVHAVVYAMREGLL